MRHGIRRAVAVVLAFAVSALSIELPRIPRVVKFNEHPFAERRYGKVIAGGRGTLDTIFGMIRGAMGAAGSLFRLLRPAAAFALLLATILALEGWAGAGAEVLAITPAFASRSLRDAKGTLVAKSRKVIEDAEAAERAVDDKAGATAEDKERARANTERAKTEARALLQQASDLDADIELATAQEEQEASLGRSQGRRAGGPDTDPGSGQGQHVEDLFEGGPLALMVEGPERTKEATHRSYVAARMIRALAAGKGDVGRAAQFARDSWGENDLAFRALSSSDETAGGALVAGPLAEAVIEFLRPMSAVRRLSPTVIQSPDGNLTLPKLTGGAAAEYVGENDNAPKTEQVFGSVKANFRSLAALVPISNKLLRYATPSVDQLVRDDTAAGMAQRSDLAFIRGPGTEHAPKGLRFWVPAANVIEADNTGALADVTTDLGKLILALEEANVRMIRPAWLFAPRTRQFLMTIRDGNGNFAFRDEMLRGTLWGWPFSSTTQIPKNLGGGTESEVYLVDMADTVIVESLALVIDASREAAYHDGSAVQSAFSRDQTVVRTIQDHDFIMRHDESIAVLPDVTWGA